MRFLLAIAATLLFSATLIAGPAAAQATTTVTNPDGTVIKTTVNGLNDIFVSITGGPEFTNDPATVQFNSVVPSASTIVYTGTISRSGTSTPFSCTLNTSTQQVTGTGACATVFSTGSGSGTSTPPATTTTTTTTTPPPVVTTTTTTDTGTTTTTTVTTSDGTVLEITTGEREIISAVEAEQFFLALVGDRLTASSMQSFVASRVQALSMAALMAPSQRVGATEGYVGRSAGGMGPDRGVWVNASGSYTDNSRPGSSQDGWTGAAAVGADVMFETTALGGYVGYDSTDLSGPGLGYESDGWTVGAYASWSANPLFRVTGSLGYGQHDVNFSRQIGALSSTGDTNRDQVFGSLSFESQLELSDRLVAIPSVGVSVSNSKTDSYVDSAARRIAGVDADLTTAQLGGALFYRGDSFLPYIMASVNEDLDDQPGIDGSYGMVGAGVALPISQAFSLSLSAQQMIAKEHESVTTFGATLRRGF
jgi:hypothetical protein